MRYSIFTPSHDPKFLDQAHASVVAQTERDWEWIVLLNHGAEWTPPGIDMRIKVISVHEDDDTDNVGGLKDEAVSYCSGEILVELDHDDVLDSEALAKIGAAFDSNPTASLVYSDSAQIGEDGEPDASTFNEEHGWRYYPLPYHGRTLLALRALPPTPHNVSHIWYAPNHVRAFQRWAYEAAGRYDPSMSVLDDQDLMARLYRVGPFVHIRECLYLQRVHDGNTQTDPVKNAAIQSGTIALYDRTIEGAALSWADRSGLLALDLGAGHGKPHGYLGVDLAPGDGVDIVASGDNLTTVANSSVGVIRAVDFMEHVEDKVRLINEMYRVLAPGGMLLSSTPSTDGRGAFQDPTHVSFYNENSFWYYTDPNLARYVPGIEARFQVSRLTTGYPSAWHQENDIPYVTANLIALKGQDFRNGGIIRW